MSEIIQNRMFKFAYTMAFRDATLRTAFQRNDGELDDEYRERKEKIKTGAYDIVKSYINEIFLEHYPNPVNTIELLCDKFEIYGFTFGNAQKLVNMTAKYMYLTTYDDVSKKSYFKECHCPMDTIMIKIVSGNVKNLKLENISYKYESWSRINRADQKSIKSYYDFQDNVKKLCDEEKDGCYPLEYDYLYYE